jgi:hypothetical protein
MLNWQFILWPLHNDKLHYSSVCGYLHSTRYNAVTYTGSNFPPFWPNSLYAFQEIPYTMRLQSIAVRIFQILMKPTFFHFYITPFQYTSIALSEIDSMDLYRKGHGFHELNAAFSALTWKGDIRHYADQGLPHFTTCETYTILNIKFAESLQHNTVLQYFIIRVTKFTVRNFKGGFFNPKLLLGVLYEANRTLCMLITSVLPSVTHQH